MSNLRNGHDALSILGVKGHTRGHFELLRYGAHFPGLSVINEIFLFPYFDLDSKQFDFQIVWRGLRSIILRFETHV